VFVAKERERLKVEDLEANDPGRLGAGELLPVLPTLDWSILVASGSTRWAGSSRGGSRFSRLSFAVTVDHSLNKVDLLGEVVVGTRVRAGEARVNGNSP